MLVARPRNSQRYIAGGVAGLVVAAAFIARGFGGAALPAEYLWAAGAGLAVFLFCATALLRGVARTRRDARESGLDSVPAEKAMQRATAFGSFLTLAGLILQAVHTMFGVPEFAGQAVLSFAAVFAGILLQMFAQVRFMKSLG